jgi:hypothetical protein
MMLVDVGTLFGRQQNPDGIYLRLDGSRSSLSLFRTAIFCLLTKSTGLPIRK